MDERAFLLLIGIVLIAGLFSGISGANNSTEQATSTSSEAINASAVSSNGPSGATTYLSQGDSVQSQSNPPAPEPLTDEELRDTIQELSDEAWELEKKVGAYLRRQPVSRYADLVTFTNRGARGTNPSNEYVAITNNRDTATEIDISNWYIESYVTETRANIPDGIYLYKDGGRLNTLEPIRLKPSQQAIIYTGESPLGDSFQENSCFGYLRDTNFFTRRSYNCPAPIRLMDRYADIRLDDDACYEYVEGLRSCTEVEYDAPSLDEISGSCRNFVRTYLSYESCVEQFSWRTDFDDANTWNVYLDRDEELWRQKREILRLRDEFDEIVAVIEY